MKKLTKVLALVAMAAALFIGCSNSSSGDSGTGAPEAKDVTVDLSKAKVGYGNIINNTADGLVIAMNPTREGDYTQVAIPLPDGSAGKKAVVTMVNSGKVTVGFMKAGSDPWGGRIDGKDVYLDPAASPKDTEVEIPSDAAFITVGSNGVADNAIVVTKIIVK